MPHNKGMDWLRLPKRMAIYYRDAFDCVWCRGVFPIDTRGYGLTLDHLDPSKGHEASNLVTCCNSCNSARKELTQAEWCKRLKERGYNVEGIRKRIRRLTRKSLNLYAGKWLASLRRPNYNRKPLVKTKVLPLPSLRHEPRAETASA